MDDEDQLTELLNFIRTFKSIHTYPTGDENNRWIYAGCLVLEQRNLIAKFREEPEYTIWVPTT